MCIELNKHLLKIFHMSHHCLGISLERRQRVLLEVDVTNSVCLVVVPKYVDYMYIQVQLHTLVHAMYMYHHSYNLVQMQNSFFFMQLFDINCVSRVLKPYW